MLNKTGELTAADVQLMKDHPDIVRELDGFREYLHNTIRRAMKAKPEDLEDPLGESEELDEDDPASIGGKSVATDPSKPAKPVVRPGKGTDVKMASGKKATVDWGGFDEGKKIHEAVTVYPINSAEEMLKFARGTRWSAFRSKKNYFDDYARAGYKFTFVVKRDESGGPAQRFMRVVGPRGEEWYDENDHRIDPAQALGPDYAQVRAESKRVKSPLLSEAVTMVMADKKGPYVIADGVEARPTNPNHTQYKAGTRVNVHRHGKKGVFIVEMPNGERWTNVIKESPKGKR